MIATTVVSASDLAEVIDRLDVIVVDCRHQLADPNACKRAFQAAHLPGARYADLHHNLADLTRPGLGRHPLPDNATLMQWLADIGWTPSHHVVAYDDAGGALAAARMWWMLRLIGHRKTSVLDGGIRAWQASGHPLTSEMPSVACSEVVERVWSPDALVDYDALQLGLRSGSLLLVDARATPRFRGEVEPIDAIAGHVPGARNRPFSDNLGGNGLFKSELELREEWLALLGDHAPENVVHMCGSGVTACHNLLAMEYAGLTGSRLFAPSWSGWISDPARPVASGDA
ncbi:MAG: sulfurtransferase [Dokdonella sp.]